MESGFPCGQAYRFSVSHGTGGNDGVGPGRCATMKLAKLLERQFDFGDMAAAGAVPK
jgi:hypothetical protein